MNTVSRLTLAIVDHNAIISSSQWKAENIGHYEAIMLQQYAITNRNVQRDQQTSERNKLNRTELQAE